LHQTDESAETLSIGLWAGKGLPGISGSRLGWYRSIRFRLS
jgi:hypothetical protein